MSKPREPDESAARLQKFAEIYQEKMAENPFMEIIVRYESMTKAHLTVDERIKADLFLDTKRFDRLLHPEENLVEIQSVK